MTTVRFVLVEPSHAGNVGAAARAIRVMGFDDLVLVRPRWPDVLQRPEARRRASGAEDVLDRARVVDTLDAALTGITHACATVMTPRDFGPPTLAPRAHFRALSGTGQGDPAAMPAGIAFLFGCERYGMANEDVYRCHVALSIPADPDHGSLNLAAAVQLIAYEWRQALLALGLGWRAGRAVARGTPRHVAADAAQVHGMIAHWGQALQDVGFLDPATPRKLMPRLQQLFNRAQPSVEEVNILRGIARTMQRGVARDADPKPGTGVASGRKSMAGTRNR